MNTSSNTSLYVCKCCRQQLPSDAFYMNKRTHLPDYYCKACCKASSHQYRVQEKNIPIENKPISYPVITEVKDPVLRMALIRHALKVVAKSIRIKQEKEKRRAQWEE